VRAAGRGCSSLRPTTGAPGGQGRNASGSFRRAAPALSRGVGGLKPANRHFAGMARMPHSRHFAGMARGLLPQNRQRTGSGAVPRGPPGPIARSFSPPSYPGGPSWRKCGGLAVRSSWRSGPAPRRGSRSRASTAGGLVEPRGVEAWQLGGDLRSLVGRSAGVPSLARASTRQLEFSRPTVTS
jgi:hypothetical protein